MELDFSALSPPNSIVSEELSNGGYSSPFQLSPMSSNQQQQQHVPFNQEKVTKTFKWKPPKAIMCFHVSISLGKHDQT